MLQLQEAEMVADILDHPVFKCDLANYLVCCRSHNVYTVSDSVVKIENHFPKFIFDTHLTA